MALSTTYSTFYNFTDFLVNRPKTHIFRSDIHVTLILINIGIQLK